MNTATGHDSAHQRGSGMTVNLSDLQNYQQHRLTLIFINKILYTPTALETSCQTLNQDLIAARSLAILEYTTLQSLTPH